jgi:hypothetical protein
LKFEPKITTDEEGNKKEVESDWSKKQNEQLIEVLDKFDFSSKVKQALKAAEFFNIALAMPVYREDNPEDQQCSIDILLPDEYVPVTEKDFLILKKINISRLDEEKNIYWLVFTADENYVMDSLGNESAIEGRKKDDMENVYGVIPIAILRKKIGSDFW